MTSCNCSNARCDCHEPVEPRTALALSAGGSTVVGTRLTKGVARELARYCASRNCTQSEVLRKFVLSLAKKAGEPAADPGEAIAAVIKALGLQPDASHQQIVDAVDALLGSGPSPEGGADGLAEGGDPPPPAQLSRADLAAMTPADRGRYHIEADAARRARRKPPRGTDRLCESRPPRTRASSCSR